MTEKKRYICDVCGIEMKFREYSLKMNAPIINYYHSLADICEKCAPSISNAIRDAIKKIKENKL